MLIAGVEFLKLGLFKGQPFGGGQGARRFDTSDDALRGDPPALLFSGSGARIGKYPDVRTGDFVSAFDDRSECPSGCETGR